MIFFNINLSQTEPHLETREIVMLLLQKQIKRKTRNKSEQILKVWEFLFDSSHVIADQYCKNLTFIFILYNSLEANIKLTASNQLGLIIRPCTNIISEPVRTFYIENWTKILALYVSLWKDEWISSSHIYAFKENSLEESNGKGTLMGHPLKQ